MLREDFTLDDRYHQKSGVIYLSGIQALVRALLEQHHYDASNDLQTGGFISGYRGSPLGGLDQALWRIQSELSARNIQFQPAVNEELAASDAGEVGCWRRKQALGDVARGKLEELSQGIFTTDSSSLCNSWLRRRRRGWFWCGFRFLCRC